MNKVKHYLSIICLFIMLVFIANGSAKKEIWKDETLTDNIYEEVEIMANDITLDLNDYCVSGNNSGTGILINNKSGVTIKNGTVELFYDGIKIENSTYCYIYDVATLDCATGIRCQGSSQSYNKYNEIEDCISLYNSDMGFALRNGKSNVLFSCSAWDNVMDGSDENNGDDTWQYDLILCNNGRNGIEMDYSTNFYVGYGDTYNNRDGVSLDYSTNGHISNSQMNYNTRDGLRIKNSSNYNHMSYCSGTGNGDDNLDDDCIGNTYDNCSW